MWDDLSRAEQDAVEEARRVASKPGEHEAAAERLARAFPGTSKARALRSILECMEQVVPPRERNAFARCLVRRLHSSSRVG